jgi:hypothetical protein
MRNTSADAAKIDFDDAVLYREFILPASERRIPSAPLLHDHAWESFQLWTESPKKIPY